MSRSPGSAHNCQIKLCFYLFPRRVPHRRRLLEIRMIGQMAADRRVVAELLVFDDFLSRADCIEKVGFVVNKVTVAGRCAEYFGSFRYFGLKRYRQRVLLLKFLQILVAQLSGPAEDGIALGLRMCVLRRVGQRLALQGQRALVAWEPMEAA